MYALTFYQSPVPDNLTVAYLSLEVKYDRGSVKCALRHMYLHSHVR